MLSGADYNWRTNRMVNMLIAYVLNSCTYPPPCIVWTWSDSYTLVCDFHHRPPYNVRSQIESVSMWFTLTFPRRIFTVVTLIEVSRQLHHWDIVLIVRLVSNGNGDRALHTLFHPSRSLYVASHWYKFSILTRPQCIHARSCPHQSADPLILFAAPDVARSRSRRRYNHQHYRNDYIARPGRRYYAFARVRSIGDVERSGLTAWSIKWTTTERDRDSENDGGHLEGKHRRPSC